MLHLLNFSHAVSVAAVLVFQGLWSGATVRVVIHVMMYHQYQFPGQSPSTRPVHNPCLTCELTRRTRVTYRSHGYGLLKRLQCKKCGVTDHECPRGAIFSCFRGNSMGYHGNMKILLP